MMNLIFGLGWLRIEDLLPFPVVKEMFKYLIKKT